jgi:hypothetical protein
MEEVICIDGNIGLDLHVIYEVLYEFDQDYYIINVNRFNVGLFPKKAFITVREYRNSKLDILLYE